MKNATDEAAGIATISAPTVGDFTGCLEQGQFEWWVATATAIVYKDETPASAWRTNTQNLVLMYQALHTRTAQAAFKVADSLNWGKEHLGEEWSDVIDTTANELHRSVSTLGNWMDIARAVAPSRRRESITTIEHYKAIAKLEPSEQIEYLGLVESENLTVTELRDKIKERHPGKPRAEKPDALTTVKIDETWPAMTDALMRVLNFLKAHEDEIAAQDLRPLLWDYRKLFKRVFKA